MNGTNTINAHKPYTTLGTAAKISITKMEGERSGLGEISDWKRATPRLTGTAIARANTVVIMDPYIDGNALSDGSP